MSIYEVLGLIELDCLFIRMSKNYLDTSNLKFSVPFDELKSSPGRTVCTRCNAKRRYYCYECVEPIDHVPPNPETKLPFKIHIIRHRSEKPSRSSIIPLKMTYPSEVFLYTFTQPDRFKPEETEGVIEPPLPQNIDWNRAAILYPGKDAVSVENIFTERDPLTDVFVIDATWFTAEQVIKRSPELGNIKRMIKLGLENKTIFWRHQREGRECLATCEAIYVLLREVWDASSDMEYNHEYDDVLFYYLFVHSLIEDNYKDTKKHRGRMPTYTLENS